MSSPYFRFKKFTVFHDLCAMKVGTDGVLLGAWSKVEGHSSVLDVGTGTGLIALMLAQRADVMVDAIDIDASACIQATKNIQDSIFADKIKVHHMSFTQYIGFSGKKYDLIVSNPPYFSQSLKCPDGKRALARHNDSLSLSALLDGCSKLMADEGRVSLILPYDASTEIDYITKEKGLLVTRKTEVIPIPGALPKRILIELAKQVAVCCSNQLVIEESRHQYTPEYIALTKDFYLKM